MASKTVRVNGFRIKPFPTPPARFDPLNASPKQLARYGIPPRPEFESAPALHRVWLQAFSHKLKFIQPKLKPRPQSTRILPQRVEGRRLESSDSDIWSGSALTISAADRMFPIVMAGTWQVPDIRIPDNDGVSDNFFSSLWVGIDGWGGSDLFQAGTEQDIARSGDKTFYAWFEWYEAADPAHTASVQFSNFGVSAGDLITCFLLAPLSTFGLVLIVNTTKRIATGVGVAPPATFAGLTGDTAEWILERPSSVDGNGNTVPEPLPAFTSTFFTMGAGSTASGLNFDINQGTLLTMKEGITTVSVPKFNGVVIDSPYY